MKKHTYLLNIIQAQPGITREEIFEHTGLRRQVLRDDKLQLKRLANGEPTHVKRYNRRLNRFIRQIRRDGVDIVVSKVGGQAFYYADGAAELAARSAAKQVQHDKAADKAIQDFWNEPVVTPEQPVTSGPSREEEPSQVVSFAQLLAALDDDALGV